ncbi:hypothetical protein ANCCEY_12119 [Ancylostoma ceylanicum]|uniref:SCP domain-containing protein n=1 Tax=Ancylostoma ceylanicum TaxID=53326 RepID=A0A0D6LA08_9BILA|nr:hypothetical protein ANCCEY_12119 [Ancylostoma ceylanicum]
MLVFLFPGDPLLNRAFSADNIFQSWDCKLEQIAKSQICSPDGIPPEYDYSYDVITLDPTFITDITVQTRAVLKKATKNAEVVDLSVEPIYHRLIRGYSMMVYGKSTRIGCSMNYCDGRGRLMCVYDKKFVSIAPDV